NLSVQLYPLYLSQWTSLLNGAWNLFQTLSLSTLMSTFSDESFYDDHFTNPQMLQMFAEKPLFRILIRIIMRHIFALCYLIVMPYFVLINLNNRRLVVLMDDFVNLASLLNSKGVQLFFCGVLFHLAIYVFTVYPMLSTISSTFSTPIQMVGLFLLFFTLNVSSNISFILTNYYKFATKVALEQVIVDYCKEKDAFDQSNLRMLISRVSRLAKINSQLSSLISVPLLFNMLPYIVQILATFSAIWLQNQNLPNNYYLVQFSIPFAYICFTEKCIQNQLVKLDRIPLFPMAIFAVR
ncbi:hypothetical protein TYRP_012326, partial [Tyrophagus putrescentiae]